jgi:thiamine-monophosphate kinase
VEGVHFTLPRFSLQDVGHKALAVNLSDLAAMGATPAWFLCAIAMPRSYGSRQVRALAAGMSALARRHRIALAGGNFTSAPALSITITAAGHAPRPLLRSGGRPGHLLFVSGTLGDARLGLDPRSPPGPARRQKRPQPRLDLGRLAARFASAAIDLSDGLARDLGHLCQASGTGAEIALERLPLSPALRRARGDRAPLSALAGGEDYELLLAIPPSRARSFTRAAAAGGHRVTQIGRLHGDRVIFTRAGVRISPPSGFDHFC